MWKIIPHFFSLHWHKIFIYYLTTNLVHLFYKCTSFLLKQGVSPKCHFVTKRNVPIVTLLLLLLSCRLFVCHSCCLLLLIVLGLLFVVHRLFVCLLIGILPIVLCLRILCLILLFRLCTLLVCLLVVSHNHILLSLHFRLFLLVVIKILVFVFLCFFLQKLGMLHFL